MNSKSEFTAAALKCLPSRRRFAKLRGITPQALCNWVRNGVSIRHVFALEKAINYQITKEQLRPDVFL